MRYAIALFCPPLAMVLARRPLQAFAATALLILAAALWPAVSGLFIAGLTVLWACHVAGAHYAADELEGLRESIRRSKMKPL
jgi:predicted anti-sigma-YlaC factor YlaD